jgi:hypothetical protein
MNNGKGCPSGDYKGKNGQNMGSISIGPLEVREYVCGEIFGHNWLRSYCFQVQPVTCCDLLDFFTNFEVYSIDSSKIMGIFLEVLNFNRLFLKPNRFMNHM